MILITNNALNHTFINTDFSIIRHRFIDPAIPPCIAIGPLTIETHNISHNDVNIPDDMNDDFTCLDRLADGTVCGKVFANFKQLQLHRANATRDGGDHGAFTVSSLIITNECCSCGTILATRAAAKQHLRNAITMGYCRPSQTRRLYARTIPILPIKCIICNDHFSNVDAYNAHIKLECPLPRVLPTAAANVQSNDGSHIDSTDG